MTKNLLLFITVLVCSIGISTKLAAQSPPFNGTIFLDPNIITLKDPTTFLKLELVHSTLQASGNYQFTLNVNYLTTGIYFIHLQVGKISTLQKLMVR